MFCSKCGKEIHSEEKFCHHCGEKNMFAESNATEPQADTSAATAIPTDIPEGTPTQETLPVQEGEEEPSVPATTSETTSEHEADDVCETSESAQVEQTSVENVAIGHGFSTMRIFKCETTRKDVMTKDDDLWHNLPGWHIVASRKNLFHVLWIGLRLPVSILVGLFAAVFLALSFAGGFSLEWVVILGIPFWCIQEACKPTFLSYLFAPPRAEGLLYLPQGMTREQAFARITQNFTHPFLDSATQHGDCLLFTGKKATVQLSIDENGMQCTMLDCETKREKKQYLYYLLCNSVKTQVISLLYPEEISVDEMVAEQNYLKAAFKNHTRNFWLYIAGWSAFIVWGACIVIGEFGGLDNIQSKGVANSSLDIFTTGATLDETFDSFFGNGKWSNDGGEKTTIVTYSGTCRNMQTNESIDTSIRFALNNETDYFSIDSVYMDGEALNVLEIMVLVGVINESYDESENVDVLDAFSDALEEAAEEAAAEEAASKAAEEQAAAEQAAAEEAANNGYYDLNIANLSVNGGTWMNMNNGDTITFYDDGYLSFNDTFYLYVEKLTQTGISFSLSYAGGSKTPFSILLENGAINHGHIMCDYYISEGNTFSCVGTLSFQS